MANIYQNRIRKSPIGILWVMYMEYRNTCFVPRLKFFIHVTWHQVVRIPSLGWRTTKRSPARRCVKEPPVTPVEWWSSNSSKRCGFYMRFAWICSWESRCFCQSLLPLRRCRCCKKNIRCLVRIGHRIRCWKLHLSRSMLTWLLLISPTLTPWSHGSPMVLGYHQHLGFKMMP